MSNVPQSNFLLTQAINHVIASIATESIRGGNWEVQSVERMSPSAANVIFAAGPLYPPVNEPWSPDLRPRIVLHATVIFPGPDGWKQ